MRLTIVFSSLSLYGIPFSCGPGKAHPGHASSMVWALFVHKDSSWTLAFSTSLAISRGIRNAEACTARAPTATKGRRIMMVVKVRCGGDEKMQEGGRRVVSKASPYITKH